jgi:hypothetical protein
MLGFCAVCASVGKFEALVTIRAEVEKHERTGEGVRIWTLPVLPQYLQRAVAWSVVPALGVAAPVCWSHAMGLQPTSGGIIPAQALPPGLGGANNIPLLGGG